LYISENIDCDEIVERLPRVVHRAPPSIVLSVRSSEEKRCACSDFGAGD
jgi:hypothetical protein